MTTIVDSLILELGLDSTNFKRGIDQLETDLAALKNKVNQQGEQIERFAKSVGFGIETVIGKMGALFGLYLSFDGFRKMVDDATKAESQIDALATSLGLSTEEASKWKQALSLIPGADSDQFFNVLRQMNDSLAWMRAGGPQPSWLGWLQSVGVYAGPGKSGIELTLEYIEAIHRKVQEGSMKREEASFRLGQLGITNAAIVRATIDGGRKAFEELYKQVDPTKITTKEGKEATETQFKWNQLTNDIQALQRAITTQLRPEFNWLLDKTHAIITATTHLIQNFQNFKDWLLNWTDYILMWDKRITGQGPGRLSEHWPGHRPHSHRLGISPSGQSYPDDATTSSQERDQGHWPGHRRQAAAAATTDQSGVSQPPGHGYSRRQGEPGEFNYAETGALGSPGPGANLTEITLKNGKKVTVNAAGADRYRGFLNELIDRGYPVEDVGGYNPRTKRGGSGWSMHAYGAAVDVNPAQNPYGGSTTNLPEDVESLAWKHGLSWGGRFGDPMHFEIMGPSAWEHKKKLLGEGYNEPSIAKQGWPRTLQGSDRIESGLSKRAYDRMYAGTPLAGKYDTVIAEARKQGIPPALLSAVMAEETGRGTSEKLRNRNNPGGVMTHGGADVRYFTTVEEGIAATAAAVTKNYHGSIEGMARTYAPVGAANDPNQTNSSWPGGVRSLLNELSAGDPTASASILNLPHSVRHGPGQIINKQNREAHINNITVNSAATDAAGIAKDVHSEVTKQFSGI